MTESDRGVVPDGPVYVDSSAFVKVLLPEPDSDEVEAILRKRSDLVISELVVTEIISAAARRMREGGLRRSEVRALQKAILGDVDAKRIRLADLRSTTHRLAERILITATNPLRAADALHLALALESDCRTVMTFDRRMAEAASVLGLSTVDVEE